MYHHMIQLSRNINIITSLDTKHEKSGQKVAKNWKKWRRVGKSGGKSGEKLKKMAKSS